MSALRSMGTSGIRLFPPLRGAVKWLIVVNIAVFVLESIVIAVRPEFERESVHWFGLSASAIKQGWLWQLLTHAFMHADTGHILFNMLSLWIFGPAVEDSLGRRRFLRFYLMAAVFGAVIIVLVALQGNFGLTPRTHSLGASGAVMAVMLAFGMFYGESKIYLIPFPVPFKAKYLVALFIGMDLLGLLRSESGTAYFGHLGGAVFAFLYVKFFHGRDYAAPQLGRGLSDRDADGYRPRRGWHFANPWLTVKDRYYRWKRRRAARKFEVYMRKHDRNVYFDEHGNYRAPEDEPPKDKENGEGRPPWVN